MHVRQAAERYLNQVPGGALVVELASGEGRNVAYLAAVSAGAGRALAGGGHG